MKKLVFLVSILMLSVCAFGQPKYIQKISGIERTPTGNNTWEDAMHRTNFPNGDYSWIQDVHFIKDGKIFLLAYEPKPSYPYTGERKMYLYSKDTSNVNNSWKVALS